MSETVFEKAHREANRNRTIGKPSELKPCPTMSHHRANCRECDAAWNQRQPHPDSARLDWLQENIDSAYTREEIDKAIEAWNQRQPHPDEELAEQFRLGYEAGRKDAMRQQAMEQEK